MIIQVLKKTNLHFLTPHLQGRERGGKPASAGHLGFAVLRCNAESFYSGHSQYKNELFVGQAY